jgi:hypothetical protein
MLHAESLEALPDGGDGRGLHRVVIASEEEQERRRVALGAIEDLRQLGMKPLRPFTVERDRGSDL